MQIVPPLYLLQTLVVFAEQENLVQTAERLGLTQPTVSRQLQQLEELFSQPLFAQQGRNKVLTDYGQALVKELKPRFTDLERVFQKIEQTFSDPREITLRAGGQPAALEHYLTDLDFDGSFELAPLESAQVQAAFDNQALDISLTDSTIEGAELICKKISSSIPCLAIPKKWAAQIETAKEWSRLCQDFPAAIFSKDRTYVREFEEKFKTEVTANFVFENWLSLEKRVRLQKSWGIIPAKYLQENSGYKIIPLTGLFEDENLYLSYRKELTRHPWMKELLSQFFES